MPSVTAADTVLEVEGLCVDFALRRRQVRVLSDISFSVARGETLGIIGESGCGKSMTALALLRMIPSPPGRITAGRVLLTHDFGAVCEMADRVLVMYAGHKVEEGTLDEISDQPHHPYTQGLLRSMPAIVDDPADTRVRLPEIPGSVPDLLRGLAGCPFAPRCPSAMSKCRELPGYTRLGNHRSVKCWLASGDAGDHAPS